MLHPNEPARLDAREIVEQVMRGVADAGRELNQPYYIDKIQLRHGRHPAGRDLSLARRRDPPASPRGAVVAATGQW